MAGSAAVVPGWPWIADAGRRTPDRHSASGTGRSRRVASGAARRGQPGARVVEPAIWGPQEGTPAQVDPALSGRSPVCSRGDEHDRAGVRDERRRRHWREDDRGGSPGDRHGPCTGGEGAASTLKPDSAPLRGGRQREISATARSPNGEAPRAVPPDRAGRLVWLPPTSPPG